MIIIILRHFKYLIDSTSGILDIFLTITYVYFTETCVFAYLGVSIFSYQRILDWPFVFASIVSYSYFSFLKTTISRTAPVLPVLCLS